MDSEELEGRPGGGPQQGAGLPPPLALVGPTGAGKSRLALRLARRLGAEIVACDSIQVYRGFDIGSAKPSRAEQTAVRHHLVDVADWHDPFDAQRWAAAAAAALDGIAGRGRPAILCGGTGLYLRALRYGLAPLPAADLQLRARLQAEAQEAGGTEGLHARLAALDPQAAARVHPANGAQVMRCLEACLLAGRPASAARDAHGFRRPRRALRVVVLDGDDAALRERLRARLAAMLAAGWEDEVAHALARGVPPSCRPMRAVGYREVVAHLQGGLDAAGMRDAIAARSWQYVRRQRTWWRRERAVQWIRPADEDAGLAALTQLWLEGDGHDVA